MGIFRICPLVFLCFLPSMVSTCIAGRRGFVQAPSLLSSLLGGRNAYSLPPQSSPPSSVMPARSLGLLGRLVNIKEPKPIPKLPPKNLPKVSHPVAIFGKSKPQNSMPSLVGSLGSLLGLGNPNMGQGNHLPGIMSGLSSLLTLLPQNDGLGDLLGMEHHNQGFGNLLNMGKPNTGLGSLLNIGRHANGLGNLLNLGHGTPKRPSNPPSILSNIGDLLGYTTKNPYAKPGLFRRIFLYMLFGSGYQDLMGAVIGNDDPRGLLGFNLRFVRNAIQIFDSIIRKPKPLYGK